jgi:hypothetical protein
MTNQDDQVRQQIQQAINDAQSYGNFRRALTDFTNAVPEERRDKFVKDATAAKTYEEMFDVLGRAGALKGPGKDFKDYMNMTAQERRDLSPEKEQEIIRKESQRRPAAEWFSASRGLCTAPAKGFQANSKFCGSASLPGRVGKARQPRPSTKCT